VKTALSVDKLEEWLWQVTVALTDHGFEVHALVCDGHPVNRALQKKLIEDAKSSGLGT
jgi:hypothetical protein